MPNRFRWRSPLGMLSYCWDGDQCHAIWLHDDRQAGEAGDDPVLRWLQAYFQGEHVPLPPLAEPFSPFQARMRRALLGIPRGQVCTYGDMARLLHTSPRAMGQALGANPLPILIPCHRVVAANGPGGFSCGVAWKRSLLTLEGAIRPEVSVLPTDNPSGYATGAEDYVHSAAMRRRTHHSQLDEPA